MNFPNHHLQEYPSLHQNESKTHNNVASRMMHTGHQKIFPKLGYLKMLVQFDTLTQVVYVFSM